MSADISKESSDGRDDESLTKVRQLLRRLEDIRIIRMATGIVMASCDLSESAAAEVLVDRCRQEGVPLAEVARSVIRTGEI